MTAIHGLRFASLLIGICFASFHLLVNAWVLPLKRGHRRGTFASSAIDEMHNTVTKTEHALRTLYDPPPGIDDDNVEASIVTRVINGTLQTEEESPHQLYYEVHHRIPVDDVARNIDSLEKLANPRTNRGLVGLVLHGGPGAGCFPRHANFFSPELYEYVVLLDQRGCGKSTPKGEVSSNTLSLLVQDVERLRLHLLKDDATPWDCILGGSWGCTLALAYAHSYSSHVRSMVLRGVCLFRPQEIDWLFGDPPAQDASPIRTSNLRDLVNGNRLLENENAKATDTSNLMRASQLFGEAWTGFCKGVNVSNTSNEEPRIGRNRYALTQYYHRLLGSDPLIRAQAAQTWFRWEMGIYASGYPSKEDNNTNKTNIELLVWDPAAQRWHYENAKVPSNISVYTTKTNPVVESCDILSLRRYSRSPGNQTKRGYISDDTTIMSEPLPIENVTETIETSAAPTNSKNPSNSTFDPASFIPSQAMLTCYYSTNCNYVIHPYKSFLSLLSMNKSWYASQLPPTIHSTKRKLKLEPKPFRPKVMPLPPCIAIQGGLDAICPPDTALDLHDVWNELELRIALGSGHSMYDPIIASELVKALDRFGQALLREQKDQEIEETFC